MIRHDYKLLTSFGANFGLEGFVGTVAHAANIRYLNKIKKRRALFSNQTVMLLSTIFGKRTVVHLIPSFVYFVNPFFVSGNFNNRHNH